MKISLACKEHNTPVSPQSGLPVHVLAVKCAVRGSFRTISIVCTAYQVGTVAKIFSSARCAGNENVRTGKAAVEHACQHFVDWHCNGVSLLFSGRAANHPPDKPAGQVAAATGSNF